MRLRGGGGGGVAFENTRGGGSGGVKLKPGGGGGVAGLAHSLVQVRANQHESQVLVVSDWLV